MRNSTAWNGPLQPSKCQNICQALLKVARSSANGERDLDDELFRLLPCLFYHNRRSDEHAVLRHSVNLIERLPASPTSSLFSLDTCRDMHVSSAQIDWGLAPSVQPHSCSSTITIYMALLATLTKEASSDLKHGWASNVLLKMEGGARMQAIIDTLAECADIASSKLHASTISCPDLRHWYSIKSLFCTSWQRAMMLFLWWRLGLELFSDSSHDFFILGRIAPRTPFCVRTEKASRETRGSRVPYMCNWALKILRSNRMLEGLDLRNFYQRFDSQFGTLPARCLAEIQRSCDGRSPYSCQRFVGAEIKDQSMHDEAFCAGKSCRKLVWDEHSYRSTSGGRAVSLAITDSEFLRYAPASKTTLAVSHVWSHGQGGRPETGLNTCLHLRYASIARAAGCDSYWMDTASIPQDHELRREAILQINTIFMTSKMTLICDRDLMAIDISDLTVEIRELILVTILVCDWNLRAWTMLEAFKAYNNVHILCKDNKTLSLKDNLVHVHREGSIDIVVLFLAVDHLIPRGHMSTSQLEEQRRVPNAQQRVPVNAYRAFHVDKAAIFLNHRHASRPGDEIVIWSLVCDSRIFERPEDLWANFINYPVNTSFLISSAPRIQGRKGLSWAPARPNPAPPAEDEYQPEDYYIAQDVESEPAKISAEGIRGKWFVLEFEVEERPGGLTVWPLPTTEHDTTPHRQDETAEQLKEIADKYVRPFRYGALLEAATLAPGNPTPIIYGGPSPGRVVAVVASSNGRAWTWKGLYTWKFAKETFPAFTFQEILIE